MRCKVFVEYSTTMLERLLLKDRPRIVPYTRICLCAFRRFEGPVLFNWRMLLFSSAMKIYIHLLLSLVSEPSAPAEILSPSEVESEEL